MSTREKLSRDPASLGARLEGAHRYAWDRRISSLPPSDDWFQEAQEDLRARQAEVDAFLEPTFSAMSENFADIVENIIGGLQNGTDVLPSRGFEILRIEETPLVNGRGVVTQSKPFRELRIQAMKEGLDLECDFFDLGGNRNNPAAVKILRVSLVLP
jgi:hypothetical protein